MVGLSIELSTSSDVQDLVKYKIMFLRGLFELSSNFRIVFSLTCKRGTSITLFNHFNYF